MILLKHFLCTPLKQTAPNSLQIWNAATQEGSSGPASRLHSALMAVLTHMVGRLGSLAIQDSHIQAVLYALLQKGLEGSPAEQEVLVEDAVKLLNATLSASSSLEPPLQVSCQAAQCNIVSKQQLGASFAGMLMCGRVSGR